jgi:hypothetical protein
MKNPFALLVLSLAAVTLAQPALAIPAFARRYKVECHFCHEGYPKLNTIGQRFKERGFRMEREDDFDAAKWLATVPIILRANVNRSFVENGDGATTSYFKGVSAGNLGTRFSYWVDDALFVNWSADDDKTLHIKPDNAWLRFDIVRGNKLYAKAGRIELDIPFTQARTPHLFSYEIYDANTGIESDSIGSYQDGLEFGGDLPGDAHWSASLVKGRNAASSEALTDQADDFDGNVFLRLTKRVSRHRFGAFSYIGRNKLALEPGQPFKDSIFRIGADANIWVSRLNLYGVYMYGSNSNALATPDEPTGTHQSQSFNGGFAQADYHLRDFLALTLRLNVVNRPVGAGESRQSFSSLFPGAQVFLWDRLKLSFEYGFLNKQRDSFGSIQAEVAF